MGMYKNIFVNEDWADASSTQVQGINGEILAFGETAFASVEQALASVEGNAIVIKVASGKYDSFAVVTDGIVSAPSQVVAVDFDGGTIAAADGDITVADPGLSAEAQLSIIDELNAANAANGTIFVANGEGADTTLVVGMGEANYIVGQNAAAVYGENAEEVYTVLNNMANVDMLAATELTVNCDGGEGKYTNYAGAYAYATGNATKSTIVIEKTNTLSGNTFDNNHKNYSGIGVLVKDGATVGNALSKWDMTYKVTVEAGGTITMARPASAGVSNVHIKNALVIGTKGSDKKAYLHFLSDSYQDGDISIRYNGSLTAYNAEITVQDLDAQGSMTLEDTTMNVAGAFATASGWYKTTLTRSHVTVGGTFIAGGLSDFSGGSVNQLGAVTMTASSITFQTGTVNIAGTLTIDSDSKITADSLTFGSSGKIKLNIVDGFTGGQVIDITGSTGLTEDILSKITISKDGYSAYIQDGDIFVAKGAAIKDGNLDLTENESATFEGAIGSAENDLTIDASGSKVTEKAEIKAEVTGKDVTLTNNKNLAVTGSVKGSNIEITNRGSDDAGNEAILNGGSDDAAAKFTADDKITFVNDGHAVVDLSAKNIEIENNSVNTITNSTIGYTDGVVTAETVSITAKENADGVVSNSDIGATTSVTIADQSVTGTDFETPTLNVYGETELGAGNTYTGNVILGSKENTVDASFDVSSLTGGNVVAQNGEVTLNGEMDPSVLGFQLDVGGFIPAGVGAKDNEMGSTTVNIAEDAYIKTHQVYIGEHEAVNDHTLNVYGQLDASASVYNKAKGELNVYGEMNVADQKNLQAAGDVTVSGENAVLNVGGTSTYGIKIGTDEAGLRSQFVIEDGAQVNVNTLVEVGYSDTRNGDLVIDGGNLTASELIIQDGSTVSVTGESTLNTNLTGSTAVVIDDATLNGELNVAWREAALDANNKIVASTGNLQITGNTTLNGTINNSVEYARQTGGEPMGVSTDPADGGEFYSPYDNSAYAGTILMGTADKAANVTLNGTLISANNTALLNGSMTVKDGAGIYGTAEGGNGWMNSNSTGNYIFRAGDTAFGTSIDVAYDGTTPIAQIDLESGAEIARFGRVWIGSDEHSKGDNAYILNVKEGALITDVNELTTRGDGTINVDGTVDMLTSTAYVTQGGTMASDGGYINLNGIINVNETGSVSVDTINIGRKAAYGTAELNINGGTVEFGNSINIGYSSGRAGKITINNGGSLVSAEGTYTQQKNDGTTEGTGIFTVDRAAGTINVGGVAAGALTVDNGTLIAGTVNIADNGTFNVTGDSTLKFDTFAANGNSNLVGSSNDAAGTHQVTIGSATDGGTAQITGSSRVYFYGADVTLASDVSANIGKGNFFYFKNSELDLNGQTLTLENGKFLTNNLTIDGTGDIIIGGTVNTDMPCWQGDVNVIGKDVTITSYEQQNIYGNLTVYGTVITDQWSGTDGNGSDLIGTTASGFEESVTAKLTISGEYASYTIKSGPGFAVSTATNSLIVENGASFDLQSGAFDNNGTIVVSDATFKVTRVDNDGTIDLNISAEKLATLGKDLAIFEQTDANAAALELTVNIAGVERKVGDSWSDEAIGVNYTVINGDGNDIILDVAIPELIVDSTFTADTPGFGISKFTTVNDAMAAAQRLGGTTINLTDEAPSAAFGNVPDDKSLWRTNGTYTFTGGNYADLATWVQTPKPAEADGVDINIIFDNAKVIAGKFRLDNGATLTIKDSHVDARSYIGDGRAWNTYYGDSEIIINNSVVGYNATNNSAGNSDAIVAGDKETNYSGHQAGMVFGGSGVMKVDNSTIFAFTDTTGGYGALGVMDKGLMEFKNSAVYAHSFTVGQASSGGATVGRDDEVATLILDNSVLRNINGDPAGELRVGRANNGKLILRNDAELDHSAKMVVNALGEVEVTDSTLSVGSITNDGTVSVTDSDFTASSITTSKRINFTDSIVDIGTVSSSTSFALGFKGKNAVTIDNVDGNYLWLNGDVTLVDSTISGSDYTVLAYGDLTAEGDLTINGGTLWFEKAADGTISGDDITVNGTTMFQLSKYDLQNTLTTEYAYFSAGSDVTISGSLEVAGDTWIGQNKEGYAGSATVTGSLNAGGLLLGYDGKTAVLDVDGGSLTADSVTVNEGSALTVSGESTLDIDKLNTADSKSFVLADDATLNDSYIGGDSASTLITAAGDLNIAGDVTLDNVNYLRTDRTHQGDLTIADGKTLTVNGNVQYYNGDIKGDGELVVSGGFIYGSPNSELSSILTDVTAGYGYFYENVAIDGATLTLNATNGEVLYLGANSRESNVVVKNGGAIVSDTTSIFINKGGDLAVENGTIDANVNITHEESTFTVAGESTLKIDSLTGGSVSVADGATLVDSNVGGTVLLQGDLDVKGGLTADVFYGYGAKDATERFTSEISGDQISGGHALLYRGDFVINADMEFGYIYLSYGGTFAVNSDIVATNAPTQSDAAIWVNGAVTVNAGASLNAVNGNILLNDPDAALIIEKGATVNAYGTIGNWYADGANSSMEVKGTLTAGKIDYEGDFVINGGNVTAGSLDINNLTISVGSSLTLTGSGSSIAADFITVTGSIATAEYQLVMQGWTGTLLDKEVKFDADGNGTIDADEIFEVKGDAAGLSGINFVSKEGNLYVKDFGAKPTVLYIGDLTGAENGKITVGEATYVVGENAFASIGDVPASIDKSLITEVAAGSGDHIDEIADNFENVDKIVVKEGAQIVDNAAAEFGNDLVIQNDGHLNANITADGDISMTNTSSNTFVGSLTGDNVDVINTSTGKVTDAALIANDFGSVYVENLGVIEDTSITAVDGTVDLSGNGTWDNVDVTTDALYLNGINFTLDSDSTVNSVYMGAEDAGALTIDGAVIDQVFGGDFDASGTVTFNSSSTVSGLEFTTIEDVDKVVLNGGSHEFGSADANREYYMNTLELGNDAELTWNWTDNDTMEYNIGTTVNDDTGMIKVTSTDANAALNFTQVGEYSLDNFDVNGFNGEVNITGTASGATLNLADTTDYFGDDAEINVDVDSVLNLNLENAVTGMDFNGEGTININKAQTFSDAAALDGFEGDLNVNAALTLDEANSTSAIFNGSGDLVNYAQLDLNAANALDGFSGNIDADGASAVVNINNDNTTAATLSGEGKFVMNGDQILNADGAINGVTGEIEVVSGNTVTLNKENATSAGFSGAGNVIAKDDLTLTGVEALNDFTGNIKADGADVLVTLDEANVTGAKFSGSGMIVMDEDQILTVDAAIDDVTGTIQVNDTYTLTLEGENDTAAAITGAGYVVTQDDLTLSSASALDNFTGDIKVDGAGVLVTLENANDTAAKFSGNGNVTTQGNLTLSTAGAINAFTGDIAADGASVVVTLEGENTTAATLSGDGTFVMDEDQTLTVDGAIDDVTGTIQVNDTYTMTLNKENATSAGFSGAGNVIAKDDLTLTGVEALNDFTGNIKADGADVNVNLNSANITGAAFSGAGNLNVNANQTLNADNALNITGTLTNNGKVITLEGKNDDIKAAVAGSGNILANADQNFTGDVSAYAGSYEAAANSSVTFSGTLADDMTLNGAGKFVLDTNDVDVNISSDDAATNLCINNNDVTVNGGTFGEVTGVAGSEFIIAANAAANSVNVEALVINAGVKLSSGSVDADSTVIFIEDIDFNGASIKVTDASTFGDITVDSWSSAFDTPYILVDSVNGTAMNYGSEVTFTVDSGDTLLEINGIAQKIDGKYVRVYTENGDLLIGNYKGESGVIYVNSDWNTTTGTIYKWQGVDGTSDRIIDLDASKTLERAVEIIRGEAGEGTIYLVKGDTYTTPDAFMTAENGVTEMIISADEIDSSKPAVEPGDVTLKGGVVAMESAASGSLTLNNISTSGNLIGGAVIDATIDASAVETALTIDGGTHRASQIAGGSYVTDGTYTTGSSSLTIQNNSGEAMMISGRVLGGAIASGNGEVVQNSASVMIDASGDAISIRGDIYAAGSGNVSVVNSSVTFTGDARDLTFTGRVSGQAYGNTNAAENSQLIFDDFNGEFNGLIQGFDTITVSGNSELEFSRKQTLTSDTDFVFDLDGRTNAADAMFTVNSFGWTYDDIMIDATSATSGEYVLVDNWDASFAGDILVNGSAVTIGQSISVGDSGYSVELKDENLVLSVFNTQKIEATGDVVNTDVVKDVAETNSSKLVEVKASDTTVTNKGTLIAADTQGSVAVYSNKADTEVVNEGTIIAADVEKYNRAIHSEGANLELSNSGVINGSIYSNHYSTTAVNIENSGEITSYATSIGDNSVVTTSNGLLTLSGNGGTYELAANPETGKFTGEIVEGQNGIMVIGNNTTFKAGTDITVGTGTVKGLFIDSGKGNSKNIEIAGDNNSITIINKRSAIGIEDFSYEDNGTDPGSDVILSGNNTSISVASNSDVTAIISRNGDIIISGSGAEITATSASSYAYGLETKDVKDYSGNIVIGQFNADGSVAAASDIKLSVSGASAYNSYAVYAKKGTAQVALAADGVISCNKFAISAESVNLTSFGTITGDVVATGSASNDTMNLDINSILDGAVDLGAGTADTLNITGVSSLTTDSFAGAKALVTENVANVENVKIDGTAVTANGSAVQLDTDLWAQVSSSSDGLVVGWGETEAAAGAALEAFDLNKGSLAAGDSLLASASDLGTDGVLSTDDFKKNNGTLA